MDMLEESGLFDPLPLLEPKHRAAAGDPEQVFPDGVGEAGCIPNIATKDKTDYAQLVLKCQRPRKFVFVPETKAGGGVFARARSRVVASSA